LVGLWVGEVDGLVVGCFVGNVDGLLDGWFDGMADGCCVGTDVGSLVVTAAICEFVISRMKRTIHIIVLYRTILEKDIMPTNMNFVF
jgi:hypothetical protein